MLAFRFEHDSSEPHPLLTFEVKSKRLLCINCKTEELYEATYHAEVLQTGYIMYTRTPHLEHLKDTVQIRRPYVWLRAHLTLGLGKPGRPNTGARCMAVSTLITSYDFGAPAHASSHEPARPCGAAGRGSGRGEREPVESLQSTLGAAYMLLAAECKAETLEAQVSLARARLADHVTVGLGMYTGIIHGRHLSLFSLGWRAGRSGGSRLAVAITISHSKPKEATCGTVPLN